MLLMDRTKIATLIPHAGAMCLLDAVIAWDATTIACLASSHRTPANPLAVRGRLEAVCGVEYAAQAMALCMASWRAVGGVPLRAIWRACAM